MNNAEEKEVRLILASMRGARDALRDLDADGASTPRDRRQLRRLDEGIQRAEKLITKQGNTNEQPSTKSAKPLV